MFAVPIPVLVTVPTLFTVAVEGESEPQSTEELRSCVLLSLKVPVARNCWVVPKGREAFAGVTAMDCRVAAVTLIVVLPLIDPRVAVIWAEPVLIEVATPIELVALLMVAMAGALELHCTRLVRS